MSVILVPYHLDEYLPDLDGSLPAAEVIAADLPTEGIWGRLTAMYGAAAERVAAAAGRGSVPVVVSGDCTTALATMAGLQRAGTDAGIVWLDAHGDVQTLETTASGYLGGLPLRLLAGYRPELIAAGLGLRPVPERQILLVGARDLDPPEVTYLQRSQIRQADAAGLAHADLPDGPFYLHIDLDVIDPAEVPGLRFPAPGGPSAAQVATAVRRLLDTGRVAAVGVACTWHPGQGSDARLGSYLSSLLGLSLLGAAD